MAPKIAIIGAGPAGCSLARLLHLGGIDAVVYEGEASPNYRSQGGTLDLHTETGLSVLKEAGLWDEFLKYARYDGEYMLVCDNNLKTLFSKGNRPTKENNAFGQRPEIDRASLRQILTESLPDGMVQWGRHVKTVSVAAAPKEGGESTGASITFADGSTASGFDLVVGADGAWSKVRAVLSDVQPLFSGVSMQALRISDGAKVAPDLHKLVNHGSVFAQNSICRASIQQLGDGSLHVSVCTRRSETPNVPAVRDSDGNDTNDWTKTCGYDPHDLTSVKEAMLTRPELLADFHPRLQDCVTKADGPTEPRSLYALPVGFRWEHQRGLTAIGDAGHLMTPFAGEGVNVAMDDARKLAAAILGSLDEKKAAASADALDAAVVAFEEEMFVRAGAVAKLTDNMLRMWFFMPGDPRDVVPKVLAMHTREHVPALLRPVATAVVHAMYFVWTGVLKREINL